MNSELITSNLNVCDTELSHVPIEHERSRKELLHTPHWVDKHSIHSGKANGHNFYKEPVVVTVTAHSAFEE